MYAKIENNCITEVSPTYKEGFEYVAVNYKTFIDNHTKGNYKICPFGVILKNGLPVTQNKTERKVRETKAAAPNRKEERLKAIKEQFEKAIDMNIKYKNGLYYKPRYASENYEPLLAANAIIELKSNGTKSFFPKEVWDSTKLHSTVMTADELQELAIYLANIYEKQFQQYKREYARVLNS